MRSLCVLLICLLESAEYNRLIISTGTVCISDYPAAAPAWALPIFIAETVTNYIHLLADLKKSKWLSTLCSWLIAISNVMSWIWRAKFVLIQPSVPVLCQYSSGFTAVEKLILHTCSSALWWTASNSYMEGRWWRCKHFHTGIFTPQLLEIQKPVKQQQMCKCTITCRSHMEKAFVFVPPADRKLQFEYF